MTPNSDEAALVALSSLPGVGPNRLRAMLLSAGSDGPLVAWRLVVDRHLQRLRPLLECVGVGPAQVAQWSAALRRLDAEALLAVHGDSGVQLTSGSQLSTVEPWSSDPEPPAVLFRLGRTVRAVPAVAIVGTRRCTGYGRRVAATIAADLAKAGVTVVSGVAQGIDGAA